MPNLVGYVIFELYEQTDRETERHTHHNNFTLQTRQITTIGIKKQQQYTKNVKTRLEV